MEKKARMPRRSSNAPAEPQTVESETTPEVTQTGAQETRTEQADSSLVLNSGFSSGENSEEARSDESQPQSTKRSGNKRTDSSTSSEKKKQGTKASRKRQKPPTMAGRAAEKERKLLALVLRYYYATIDEKTQKVEYLLTPDQIAERIRLPRDDKDEKDGRHPLALDLRAHFDSVEGLAKWKVNTAERKEARKEHERVQFIRGLIAKQLGCESVETLSSEQVNGVFVQAGVAPLEPTSRSSVTRQKGFDALHVALIIALTLVFGLAVGALLF